MQRFLLSEEVTLSSGLLTFLAFLSSLPAPLICTNLAQNELKFHQSVILLSERT